MNPESQFINPTPEKSEGQDIKETLVDVVTMVENFAIKPGATAEEYKRDLVNTLRKKTMSAHEAFPPSKSEATEKFK